jgi:hypothetical protein
MRVGFFESLLVRRAGGGVERNLFTPSIDSVNGTAGSGPSRTIGFGVGYIRHHVNKEECV